jgi:sarcosine oxidase, subunit beta
LSHPSVAVIGGGVAGLSTALAAAELGCEVTVLERDRLAIGSSSRSAGIFNICSTEALQVEVRVRTRELLEQFERENSLPLNRIGYLRLARSEAHIKAFEDVIGLQRELGVEPAVIVDAERIKEIVPDLYTDDLLGAIHSPRDGCMDGQRLCGVFAERAEASGATIVQGIRVVGCERTNGRHRLLTDRDPVEADVIVNAAGPWAAQVGELLGHPLPLVNQAQEVFEVSLPATVDYALPMVQEYIPGGEQATWFRQSAEGGLIAGMHTYSAIERGSADPESYEASVSWATQGPVSRRVSSRLRVDGLDFQPGWPGLYPVSTDGAFVVGPYEADPSIVACGGFGGQGLTSSSVGRVTAEWIVRGEPRSLPAAAAWLPDRPALG